MQYSGLTADHWQQRHQDYQTRGITDVWLWLPAAGKHTASSKASGSSVEANQSTLVTARMNPAQHAAVRAGQPALWVLLGVGEHIATGYSGRPYQEELDLDRLELDKYWWLPERLERTGLRPPDPDQPGQVTVAVDPLAACTLTPQGLRTPMLVRLHAERDALQRLAAPSQQQAQRGLELLAAARERVQTRLLPRLYAELAAPDIGDRGVRASGADVRAWLYETLRGHLLTARGLPVDELVEQCRATGVGETRNRGVERVVTRFLTRLRDSQIIAVQGRPQQQITRGPQFDRWEPYP